MNNISLDDQILDDWNHKLTINTNEESYRHVINQNRDLSMDDSSNHNISDEDISMRDYTEEEEYEQEIPINLQDNLKVSDTLDQNIQLRQRHFKSINDENELHTNTDGIKLEKDKNIQSKSLIPTILQPETQGYLLGKLRSQKQEELEGHENGVDHVDETINDDTAKLNPTIPTRTIYGKLDDKNVIIHNHFYNIIPPNYDIGDSSVDSCQNCRYWTENNQNNHIRIFENIKRSINYSILILLGYIAITQISKDISLEYQKLIIREEFEREQCMNDYEVNRCDEYGQLPELKNECLEWKICFSSGNTHQFKSVFYSELVMQVIGRLINETLDNIGGINRIFLLCCLTIWYFGNFLCGYVKGAQFHHEGNSNYISRSKNVIRQFNNDSIDDNRPNKPLCGNYSTSGNMKLLEA